MDTTDAARAPWPVRVFLLDDHEVVRRGVRDLLDAEPDLEVVGEAATCAQALARVPALRPDAAVLHLQDLWIRDVTITTGLVDTHSTPMLLDLLAAGRIDVSGLVTHRFGLDEMQEAYDVFAAAGDNGALKVALFRT